MIEPDYDITQPYLGLIQQYRPKPDTVDMDTQRRIAKGNALAEAFRVLIDAAGASKGSNVQERTAPTNAVLGAVDKYWKAKEANKAEQSKWDQMELGAGIKALETESQNRFATQKQKEAQQFSAEEAEKGRIFTQGENVLNREQQANTLKQQAEQFRQNLGMNQQELSFKKETAKTDAEIEREKITSQNMRYMQTRPYGYAKGVWISDPDIQKQINIPDDKRAQVLAYIEADPAVKDQIPVIKLGLGNVPPTAQAEYLIAQTYSSLSPETRAKIRQFVGESPQTVSQTNKQGDQFLFYKNTPPAQPVIKTDKNSTMVQVQQPDTSQQNTVTPDQAAIIQKVIQAKNYTPEFKRAAIYKYLIEQGYDENSAKVAAEGVYQSLTGN